MSWVRIHDGAMSHPKVIGLADKAFRLWIWGLCYCQTHLTNGFIPAAAVSSLSTRKIAHQLAQAALWELRETGWQVHDYLDWNDSRDLITKKRTEAKTRMAIARQKSSREHPENFLRSSTLGRVRESKDPLDQERESEGKHATRLEPNDYANRAGRLVERYAELYALHRLGAKYRPRPVLDWQDACTLVPLWDDARLEKLAEIFLTTNEEWITKTDRSFKLFALKASWADEKLRKWEATHGAVV